MTLIDANILLYARDSSDRFHQRASAWLTERLNAPVRAALPWQSLIAFVRIATHPRAYDHPLSPAEAWGQVEEWLAAPASWVPSPTERHGEILGGLVERYGLRGNLVSDAHLAALAIEHGLEVASADTDFARFGEVAWVNPVG